jgi:hypothetical protein
MGMVGAAGVTSMLVHSGQPPPWSGESGRGCCPPALPHIVCDLDHGDVSKGTTTMMIFMGGRKTLRAFDVGTGVDASAIKVYCCAARITLGSEIVLKL